MVKKRKLSTTLACNEMKSPKKITNETPTNTLAHTETLAQHSIYTKKATTEKNEMYGIGIESSN